MDSQSSSHVSTPRDLPATPQPLDLDVPSKVGLPSSIGSPTTSMLVAGASSSMTPPPSSQARPRIASSKTPEPATLSSPPPTAMNTAKRNGTSNMLRPSADQVANAGEDDLRAMLETALRQNEKLGILLGEARMSAAHYKLQHNLLTIESEETMKRMEVEHDMTRREVQVLQNNGQGREAMDYVVKLKDYCKNLEDDHLSVLRRLERAKKIIADKDDEIVELKDENRVLVERIRQNREHINVLRSPGGPLHVSTPKIGPTTPQQHRYTPKHTPRSVRYIHPSQQDNQDKFDALLQASSVLSQENNSAPSTPLTARHPNPRTPNRHNRGVLSLSSLPTTPGSGRFQASSALLPAAVISPRVDMGNPHSYSHHQSGERRRKSRDSTISAEDHEEIARAVADRYREESEIPESQASQNATEMLRADPRESFEVAKSRTTTPIPAEKNLHQSKIFGSVTKRKLEDERHDSSKKRSRTGEPIGLGIGFEPTRV